MYIRTSTFFFFQISHFKPVCQTQRLYVISTFRFSSFGCDPSHVFFESNQQTYELDKTYHAKESISLCPLSIIAAFIKLSRKVILYFVKSCNVIQITIGTIWYLALICERKELFILLLFNQSENENVHCRWTSRLFFQ